MVRPSEESGAPLVGDSDEMVIIDLNGERIVTFGRTTHDVTKWLT